MRSRNFRLLSALAFGLSLLPAALPASDLKDAFDLVRASDPQLAAADARLSSTRELRRQSVSQFLPQLSGRATVNRGPSDVSIAGRETFQPDTDEETWSISLRQSIWDQANLEGLRGSLARIDQSESDYQAALQDALLRVSERYFEVLTAKDALAFAEAEEEALERQLEQAEQRFEVGLTAITDVHEARARYDNARASVITAENALNDAREALAEVTGQPMGFVAPLKEDLPLAPPDPADPEDWVRVALDNNPTLAAFEAAAEAAERQIGLERAGHFPTVDLTATYSDFTNNSFVLRDQDTGGTNRIVALEAEGLTYGLELNVPIFSGLNTSSRVRQAGHDFEVALQQLEEQRRLVVRNTRNAYRGTLASILEVEARAQAVVSAESALEATEAGFEVGTRTIVDVLLSQQQLYQAAGEYSRARHAYIVNGLRLRRAAGVVGPDDVEQINQLLDLSAEP